MTEVHNRVYLNTHPIPTKQEGESEADFQARMEYFRKNDLRVPIANQGKINFGFDRNYIAELGVINNTDEKPRVQIKDNEETGEVFYQRYAGGTFSVVQPEN